MRVVIVDDHPLVLTGLVAVFASEDDIEVVGQAATVEGAVRVICEQGPDVALIDLKLRTDSGLSVIHECKPVVQDCRYVVLTSSASRSDFAKATQEGVDGYALKEALPEELLYAMRIVAKGRRYYDPIFLEEVPYAHDGFHEHLTPKEMEVLRSLGRGLTNREIAHELFITEFTVKKHVSQVLAKLNLADRTQAALWANANGLSAYPAFDGG
ncbi:LuxR C-terminal-related transcriptional regulator [Alicyclobacillus mengziensis]|uniref:Response regulator transcription factor n=1 Tax=Alicyclobacillus mengziensis TaxID=2931921 RepID=A0A9X7Z6F0_9BACL|nr:response regulator transcription factor [Alicyclobacillus mengziensis]QSO47297.1 response regulator transcription factor [Alicyclobacillus mengziensis]